MTVKTKYTRPVFLCNNMHKYGIILREKKCIYMYKEGDLTAIIALIKEKYTSQNVYLILCVSLIGSK